MAAYFNVVRLTHGRAISSELVAIMLAMRVTLNDVPRVTQPNVKNAFAACFFFLFLFWGMGRGRAELREGHDSVAD